MIFLRSCKIGTSWQWSNKQLACIFHPGNMKMDSCITNIIRAILAILLLAVSNRHAKIPFAHAWQFGGPWIADAYFLLLFLQTHTCPLAGRDPKKKLPINDSSFFHLTIRILIHRMQSDSIPLRIHKMGHKTITSNRGLWQENFAAGSFHF